jgi:aryl-alcohol dehydrogenase-like predicted oxidoreductase
MEKRRIGTLEVSVIGLGTNNFGGRIDYDSSAAVVAAALEEGINFFDTADIYGKTQSEEFLGRALGSQRSQVVIATKFGNAVDPGRKGAHPDYIARAVEDSLRRLGTDYIDLYILHTPDPSVPIADTLGALDMLVTAGKVREIGCSNFSVEQLREADAAVKEGSARFTSVQNEYSLIHREPEEGMLAECERLEVAFVPYFPLASGLLTGKYRKGEPIPEGTRLSKGPTGDRLLTEENLEIVEKLAGFAESRGRTILELAFSWLLAHSVVPSVIAGATSAMQVIDNAAAAGWKMTPEDLAELDAMAVTVE